MRLPPTTRRIACTHALAIAGLLCRPPAFAELPPIEFEGGRTGTVNIKLLTGPQNPSCAFKTRNTDVIEVEYSAKYLKPDGSKLVEFDSSEMRSGRPFAFTLGNGDVIRGLELGCFEMCIGEERLLRVPSVLGFGTRGSKTYSVPPNAPLEYTVKLVSINMQTDPNVKRVDIDDEQRFRELSDGTVVNAATMGDDD